MKIILCPDKFKGSLSAKKVCEALRKGLFSVSDTFQIIDHPLADGGDGSIEILKSQLFLQSRKVETIDPLGRPLSAEYYTSTDTAFIELASASGIVLLSEEERNPLLTSTIGTGIMILDAVKKGFKQINLFIGGSATNDGGIGIAQALGFEFFDDSGNSLDPIGGNLIKIDKIKKSKNIDLEDIVINVLCDVENPMHGPNGAAYIYAAQKGADRKAIELLDSGMKNYDTILKLNCRKDISEMPGMGAAGGVGVSLVALLNAQLKNGFQLISEITKLKEVIESADYLVTGEGKIDKTSFQGKVVGNVLSMSQLNSTPCAAIGGMIEDADLLSPKFFYLNSVISLAGNLQDAMDHPEKYLNKIGSDLGNTILKF